MSRTRRLPWCGQCDEASRMVETPEGFAARCPDCHAGRRVHAHDAQLARTRRVKREALGLLDETCPACGERIYRTHRCRASALDPRSPVHAASIREIRLAVGE